MVYCLQVGVSLQETCEIDAANPMKIHQNKIVNDLTITQQVCIDLDIRKLSVVEQTYEILQTSDTLRLPWKRNDFGFNKSLAYIRQD